MSNPAVELSSLITPDQSKLRRVFFNASGLRALWRLGIFVVLIALSNVLSWRVVRFIALNLLPRGAMRPPVGGVEGPFPPMVIDFVKFAALLAVSWVMSRLERRRVGEYGLPLRPSTARYLAVGTAWAIAGVSFVLGMMHLFHGYDFGSLAMSGGTAWKSAGLWALALLAVALFEEYNFRGYMLRTLAEGIGFWPAAVVMSLWFAAGHLDNPGENKLGVAAVFLVGLVLCFMLRRTGSLWMPVGFHFGWDLMESFVYGVPDSGMTSQGRLLVPSIHGPAWLTGGSVGPEGSVLCLAFLALLMFAIHRLHPARRTSG